MAIWYKRLEAGTFELPAVDDEASHVVLSAADLGLLLGGIDLGERAAKEAISKNSVKFLFT